LKNVIRIVPLFLLQCLSGQDLQMIVQQGLRQDSVANYKKAIEIFTEALAENPESSTLWYNRGVVHMHADNYSLAVVDFNKAVVLDTSNSDAYFNRSLAYRLTGNYQFAFADICQYLLWFPLDTNALRFRADLALEMKDYAAAEMDYYSLFQISPHNQELQLQWFQVLLLNKKYDKAESILNEWITGQPENLELYYKRAFVRHLLGNYSGSQDDIHVYILNHAENLEIQKLKADNLFYLQQFSQALAIYEDLLMKDSLNPDLLADYGHCLLQLRDYYKAENVLTKSIQLKNNDPAYAYLGRGIARSNIRMGDKACEDWNKSLMLGETRAKKYLELYCIKENLKENVNIEK